MTDPDGRLWDTTWDAADRLASIWNTYNQWFTFAYDPVGREIRRTLANGVSVSHVFDEAGRVAVLSAHKADGTAVALYTATYDDVGNRLTVRELDGTRVTFGYDALYRLTLEQRDGAHGYNTTLTFGAAGNRLTYWDTGVLTTSGYDPAGQLLLSSPSNGSPTAFTFDQNGNMVGDS